MHLVRYFGVLAPNSKFRRHVIPGLTRAQIQKKKEAIKETNETISLLKKSLWVRLLARVFQIDISKCRDCGSEMKIISSIKDPPVIEKILNHCGLNPRPPPIAPARYREQLIV